MATEGILKSGIEEFLIIGRLSEERKFYRAAVSNYFKALAGLCDFILFRALKKVPSNHNERFNLLRDHKYKAFNVISSLFKSYTDTYTNYSSPAVCEKVKNGIKRIAEIEGLGQEFGPILEKI